MTDDGHELRPGDTLQQQVDDSAEQLAVACRTRDHLGQTAQHVDPPVGVAETHTAEQIGREGLFRDRKRRGERNVNRFLHELERGPADDKVLTRREPAPLLDPALKEDGISRLLQLGHIQPAVLKTQLHVAARNALVPRHVPTGNRSAQHVGYAVRQLATPALMRLGSLRDQVRHGALVVSAMNSPGAAVP